MFLTSVTGEIKKYNSHYEILIEYIKERLRMYGVRREKYILQLEIEIRRLDNIIRFLRMVISGEIVIMKISQKDLINILAEKKFDKHENSYSYLYMIPAVQLTTDNMEKRDREASEKKRILNDYKKQSPEQLWISELDELEKFI